MNIEVVPAIINTILLLILLLYQKNRNKVLLDRVEQQEKLLNETKGIVSKQSTAIDSQSKVVDTAIKYSQFFDPQKLEEVIRKEFEVEHKVEIAQLKSQYEGKLNNNKVIPAVRDNKTVDIDILESVIRTFIEDLTKPVMITLILLFYHFPIDERKKIISNIPEGTGKDIIVSVIEDIDKKLLNQGINVNSPFLGDLSRVS